LIVRDLHPSHIIISESILWLRFGQHMEGKKDMLTTGSMVPVFVCLLVCSDLPVEEGLEIEGKVKESIRRGE
jgi:hypothetical protein